MRSTTEFYVLVHAPSAMLITFIYCGLITINPCQKFMTLMFLWDAYLTKEEAIHIRLNEHLLYTEQYLLCGSWPIGGLIVAALVSEGCSEAENSVTSMPTK